MVNPFIHHNLYMSANTVTHVIKFGSNVTQADWFSSLALDKLTKYIPESDLLKV